MKSYQTLSIRIEEKNRSEQIYTEKKEGGQGYETVRSEKGIKVRSIGIWNFSGVAIVVILNLSNRNQFER